LPETVVEYTQRLLSYSEGSDPLTILGSTPDKLASLVRDRTSAQLMSAPAPGKWSITQILAHLADAELAIAWRHLGAASPGGGVRTQGQCSRRQCPLQQGAPG